MYEAAKKEFEEGRTAVAFTIQVSSDTMESEERPMK